VVKKVKKVEKEDIGGLPLNALILAKWRDGSWRPATLLDKSKCEACCRVKGGFQHAVVQSTSETRAGTPPDGSTTTCTMTM
jgi:hypothetical protein